MKYLSANTTETETKAARGKSQDSRRFLNLVMGVFTFLTFIMSINAKIHLGYSQ
jgi:hypothetical protein